MNHKSKPHPNLVKETILFVAVIALIALPLLTSVGAVGHLMTSAMTFVLIAALAILLFPFIGYPLLLLLSVPAQLFVGNRRKQVEKATLRVVSPE